MKWFNVKEGCSLAEVQFVHRKIHAFHHFASGLKEYQGLFKLNNIMLAVMTAVIKWQSFYTYDLEEHISIDDTIQPQILEWIDTDLYKDAIEATECPAFNDPGYFLAAQVPLNKDVTDKELRHSIFSADSTVPDVRKRAETIFHTDADQMFATIKQVKEQHQMSLEDLDCDHHDHDDDWLPLPCDVKQPIDFKKIEKEYADYLPLDGEFPDGCPYKMPSIAKRMEKLNFRVASTVYDDQENDEQREEEDLDGNQESESEDNESQELEDDEDDEYVAEEEDDEEDEEQEDGNDRAVVVRGVHYHYGRLFYDEKKRKMKFNCTKDESRENKGHPMKTLIKNRSKENVRDRCAKLVDNDLGKLWDNLFELLAFAFKNWKGRRAAERLKNKSTEVENPDDFFRSNDYFEQVGKEYLKDSQLVAVVEHPQSHEVIEMVYPIWRRYRQQIVKASKTKVKYRCRTEECKERRNMKLPKKEFEDHIEFQLVKAFVCCMPNCGSQSSSSATFPRHFTTMHVKTKYRFKQDIERRCEELAFMTTDQITDHLTNKIFSKDKIPVVTPYSGPSLQIGSRARRQRSTSSTSSKMSGRGNEDAELHQPSTSKGKNSRTTIEIAPDSPIKTPPKKRSQTFTSSDDDE